MVYYTIYVFPYTARFQSTYAFPKASEIFQSTHYERIGHNEEETSIHARQKENPPDRAQ